MSEMLIQIVVAFFGALGYGIIFRMKLDKLFWGALGGMITWMLYLILMQIFSDTFIAFLIASVFATIYAEVLARVKKAPATIFVLPAVIPLIPGGSLYYTIYSLMRGETQRFQTLGPETLKMALAIAIGVLIVGVCWNFVEQILVWTGSKRHKI